MPDFRRAPSKASVADAVSRGDLAGAGAAHGLDQGQDAGAHPAYTGEGGPRPRVRRERRCGRAREPGGVRGLTPQSGLGSARRDAESVPAPYSLALAMATDPARPGTSIPLSKKRVCPSYHFRMLVGCRVTHEMCERTSSSNDACAAAAAGLASPDGFQLPPSPRNHLFRDLWVVSRWRATGRDAESVPGAIQTSSGDGDGPGAMLFHTTPKTGSVHRTILVCSSGVELV